ISRVYAGGLWKAPRANLWLYSTFIACYAEVCLHLRCFFDYPARPGLLRLPELAAFCRKEAVEAELDRARVSGVDVRDAGGDAGLFLPVALVGGRAQTSPRPVFCRLGDVLPPQAADRARPCDQGP